MMKFKLWNENPFHHYTEDCVVRAIAKCEDISWDRAYKGLFRVALKAKLACSDLRTLKTYLKPRYTFESISPVRLRDFTSPEEHLLLLSSSKNCSCHLIFTDGSTYYDAEKLDQKEWRVVEVYTPFSRGIQAPKLNSAKYIKIEETIG